MAKNPPLSGWLTLKDGRVINLVMIVWYRFATIEYREGSAPDVVRRIDQLELALVNQEVITLSLPSEAEAYERFRELVSDV